ncbi:Ankyrin repeat protein [Pandoravirus kuranda]|uniref:Ankyrin repeat protein n=1 Tax=Pandoravirus kuranda TaxID=3019033 RepID=A0AA95ED50_9VIRU|nr:Ankyrin repeat protein [Pandoravirus kuranda]
MNDRDSDESAPVMLAPPEILCCVLDLVPDRDFYAARKAHRVFWVASDRAIVRRRERLWLRTSPERACAAGRTDVIQFLWRRKRIPRTFDLWRPALATGGLALVGIALEQDASKKRLDDVRDKLMRQDARDTFLVLLERLDKPIESTIDRAIQLGATGILTLLLGVAVRIRPRWWAQTASTYGNVDALRILLDRYPWIPLGSVAARAALSYSLKSVDVLSLIHQRDPLFPWQRVLLCAARRGSIEVIEYVCCRLAPPALDLETAIVEAARRGQARVVYFLGRWPVRLQAAVDASDEGGGTAGLQAVAGAVLERAVERDRLDWASFIIHETQAPIDLRGALAVARSPRMVEMVAGAIDDGHRTPGPRVGQ